ncbi:MAG TPA: TonB-dependent receptor [Bryobacteraceae bacterium]|nr:TonB-dependent receptor [Bryobacteraceae bacterium]
MVSTRRVLCIAGLFALAVFSGSNALAQSAGTGALTATVTDASGAVIPGASVTVSHPETGLNRTQTTESNGSSTFTLLPPGNYSVSISAAGFGKVDLPSVTVNVTETRALTQRLTVGTQQQEVTVEAVAQNVQTENATLGGVVATKSISDLPLVTRNFTQIMGLSAGISAPVTNAAALGRGFGSIYSNGQNDISNSFQIDGVTVNEFGGGSASGGSFFGEIPTPSPDALQEFKVQTAQYDASFGRNSGAQVSIITKSGSNALHGSAFEFFRNEDLNANDWFRNRNGQARGLLRQNQYGGTVGGKITKDKLFYFLSYQGTKQFNGVAASGSSTVSVPAQLTDDRSAAALGREFCPANNPIINTATNAGGTQVACDGSNINPVALAVLNFKVKAGGFAIPTPQLILNQNTSKAIGFSAFSIPARFSENQELGNVDYVISPKHSLALKASYAIAPQQTYLLAGQPPGGGAISLSGSQVESAKLTSLISSHMVNEARFSLFYIRASNNTTDEVTPSAIGLRPVDPSFNVMPILTVTGYLGIGGGGTDGSHAPQQTYEYSDQLSWTSGRQTIKGGVDVQRVDYNIDVTGIGRGGVTFQTFSDFLLGESAAQNGSPTGLSNILSSNGTALPPGGSLNQMRANQLSAFVQDDYKLSQRFTLNLGLRWEYDGTGYDVDTANGGGNASWTLDQTVPIPPASGTYVGYTVANNFAGAVPAGVVKRPLNLLTNGHAPYKDFAPRIGFAWQPFDSSGKFVVRGGFGNFYQVMQGNIWLLELNNNPPIAAKFNLSGAANNLATFAVPYNPPVVRGFFPSFLRTPTSSLSQQALDPSLITPWTYDFNLNLQYAINPTVSLEVGFVGTRSEHLVAGSVLNTPQIATAGNPINCGGPSGCITTNTAANAAQRVPVLGITSNGVSYGSNVGDAESSSLQATLRKQFSHGLQAQAAYTFGRVFTDVSGTVFTGGYAGTVTSNDPTNRAQMHGLADYNRTHRLVVNYSYQLPDFHKNQGFAGRALSSWGVSGVTIVQSGLPMTLTDTGGAILGLTTVRAQMCPGFTYGQLASSGGLESNLNSYFNLNAVADTTATKGAAGCPFPIVGQVNGAGGATGFGNTGRSVLIGPGQFNFDASLIKNLRTGGLSENASLQLRAEFFNLFNHPTFNNPSTVVNAATFGQISATSVAPRIVQLALRYSF